MEGGNVSKSYPYGFEPPHELETTPLYVKLRAEEPVARIKLPHGEESWLVTRHETNKILMTDRRFSRAAVMAADEERVPRASAFPARSNPISAVDPPEHTKLRQLIAGWLSRQQAEQRRPRARQIADELIDAMLAAGQPGDLVEAFAVPFPLMMIGEIFGVPPSDRAQFRDWAVPVLSHSGTNADIESAYARMRGYMGSLLARKYEHPEDDLLSTFMRAEREGRFTRQEMINLAVALVLNDSVTTQISSFLFALLTHPDQLAWLRADPSRVPQAVEELLRYAPLGPDTHSGGGGHIRMAMEDLELDGVSIRAGEFVLPAIASANRDERVFTDAEKLDLSRNPNPHIAFGHGIHRCPGEKVGRMELQVAMETVVRRIPNVRLAVPVREVPWKVRMVSRGPTKLLAEW